MDLSKVEIARQTEIPSSHVSIIVRSQNWISQTSTVQNLDVPTFGFARIGSAYTGELSSYLKWVGATTHILSVARTESGKVARRPTPLERAA